MLFILLQQLLVILNVFSMQKSYVTMSYFDYQSSMLLWWHLTLQLVKYIKWDTNTQVYPKTKRSKSWRKDKIRVFICEIL